jgi:hypothetical protein
LKIDLFPYPLLFFNIRYAGIKPKQAARAQPIYFAPAPYIRQYTAPLTALPFLLHSRENCSRFPPINIEAATLQLVYSVSEINSNKNITPDYEYCHITW